MAEMTKELRDLINSGGYCYLATASKEGMPNVAIIGSTRAVSPDTVVLAAGFMNKNFRNLEKNPKSSVIVYSGLPSNKMQASMEDFSKAWDGQIKGSVTLHTSGEVRERMKTVLTAFTPMVVEFFGISVLFTSIAPDT